MFIAKIQKLGPEPYACLAAFFRTVLVNWAGGVRNHLSSAPPVKIARLQVYPKTIISEKNILILMPLLNFGYGINFDFRNYSSKRSKLP